MTSRAGTRLIRRRRDDTIALRALLLHRLTLMWPLLDPLRLDQTTRVWLDLMVDLIVDFHGQAVDRAARWYRDYRLAETGDHYEIGDVNDLTATDLDRFRTSLLVTGPARIKHRTARGMDPDEAGKLALVDVGGAATRHVLDGGRSTIRTLTERDDTAILYARVCGPNPCAFCALMAARGPIYDSRLTAGAGADAKFTGDGEFKFHDHCVCDVIPVFGTGPFEGRDRARRWDQLYRDVTGSVSGKDKLREFRRAYDQLTR